ncbi:DNA-binding transcriptional regulator, AcrR family [Nonomuraea maritima]|uniref:DNA-binding transcriptional regulator, AcrR family n=1 Tax=Nonomuraea maritima TaxID=683260 RepID=A0A1G9HWA2_9ACTN|nr:TetR/AcrR family transcriptional regulator [Nonomuraea maritima]SDL17229.1 DNA-binding transcriptional regulator, AcrR family [Nonomuraea maritima]
MPERSGKPTRDTYRHGNLHQALLEAGTELARTGGPDAISLREVTRQAGVAPNAAYRHFPNRDALVQAVSLHAMAELALAMEEDLAALPPTDDPTRTARARFRAVGTGYLRFARTEPGLFRTAFYVPDDMTQAQAAASTGQGGMTPFELLCAALDGLVTCGLMSPERRPGAEFLVWSCVHGLAVLLIDGPLRGLPDEVVDPAVHDLIDLIEKGLRPDA